MLATPLPLGLPPGHCPPAAPSKSFTIDALLGRPDPSPPRATRPATWPMGPWPGAAFQLQLQLCAPPLRPACCLAPGPLRPLAACQAGPSRAKRVRTIFSSEQLARLEQEFARQQYMVGTQRCLLASALRLSEEQVKVWFQNRRIKWRKQSLEQQQAKLVKMGLATSQRSPDLQTHQGEEGDRDFPEEPTHDPHLE